MHGLAFDIAHLLVGADLSQAVGTMRNFIPERMVRATGRMMRMNIDDGDIFIGEFANGTLCSVQTSFVTVGNYPGIEARINAVTRGGCRYLLSTTGMGSSSTSSRQPS